MKIIDALKIDNLPIRVGLVSSWLYWDEIALEWVVLKHEYGSRKQTVLYRGTDEDTAVSYLIQLEE